MTDQADLAARLAEEAANLENCLDAGMTAEAGQAGRALAALALQIGNGIPRGNGAAPEPQTVPFSADSQAPQAEEALLGAMLVWPAAIAAAASELAPGDFYSHKHGLIYAALANMEAGAADAVTAAAELGRQGRLEEIGGRVRLHELAALAAVPGQVVRYARIVRRCALERAFRRTISTQPIDPDAIAAAALALHEHDAASAAGRATTGAAWLEQGGTGIPAVWGQGDVVLWAEGEPLMLYGPDGVGKTSISQQLVLHLAGVRLEPFLGLPVRRTERPVLYLAADRPKQARRSLARMVTPEHYPALDEKLLVWEGPLPFAITENPRALLEFVNRHGAGTFIIDSLKDICPDLSKEESAARIAHGFQWLSAEGIELCVLHHPRKAPAGEPAKPKTFEDIYGNRLLHGGFGSVLLIWGQPGDPIVDLVHLKQPGEEWGPKQALHDHARGHTQLHDEILVGDLLARVPAGLTADNVASHLFHTDAPERKQVEKARRRLERLVRDGQADKHTDAAGVTRYRARP